MEDHFEQPSFNYPTDCFVLDDCSLIRHFPQPRREAKARFGTESSDPKAAASPLGFFATWFSSTYWCHESIFFLFA